MRPVAGKSSFLLSVRLKGTMAIGRFNLIPRPGLEPTVKIDICESAVLNHFAIKAFFYSIFFIAKWLSTALSQMSILTVGSSPGRGMSLNLPIAIVPLRRTDKGYWIFQSPAAYLGDEQMLSILGRGHSVPTVTELIFVRVRCINHFATKVFCTSRNNKWIRIDFCENAVH